MSSRVAEIFEDKELKARIQKKLPHLFSIAELESSRAGKIGMEVGSIREKIIGALLIYKFGEKNVEIEIPITEPEIDLKLFGKPISVKTVTGKWLVGVKIIWTVDTQKAIEFRENYSPRCDILLVQINWDAKGGFYYVPLEVQIKMFRDIGREKYIKLPKPGTNPRGVEVAKEALEALVIDKGSKSIEIYWERTKMDYNPYKRWVDYWRKI